MKTHYLIIGIFTLLGLAVQAQGPMSSSVDNPKGPKKIRYTIEKSALSSDKHVDFGAYINKGKLYFLSDRKMWPVSWADENQQPFLDLFVVDLKNGLNAEFAGTKINGKLNEGPICFSSDGSRVYYTRDYEAKNGEKAIDGTVHLALYTAKIKGDKWEDEMQLSINNLNYSVGHPVLSNNGKYLYFSSNKPGGKGGTDIYRAKVQSNGDVGEAETLVGEINSPGNELFPSIGSKDELYFSSTGHEGLGGLDIFMAIYKGDTYTRITNVGYPVNTDKDDFAYIPGDLNKGYFSSNRDSTDDIYSFNQVVPFRFVPIISGVITLEDAPEQGGITVELMDLNGNVLNTQVTDAKGNYTFDLEEESQYNVRYTLEGYDPQDDKISTLGDGFGLTSDIVMKRDNGVEISLKLIALKTGLAVEGATVTMIDNQTNKLFMSQLSGPGGSVSQPMLKLEELDSIDLTIKIAKEGYLTKEVNFQYTLKTMQDISLDEFFGNSLKMNRVGIKTGVDASLLIDILPFYFDSTNFTINRDIARELDKVVAFMKENSKMHIRLRAHTDSRGKSTDNQKVSTKRAKASVDYIISKGISSSRISGRGFGEKEIINQCRDGMECSEEDHRANCRMEYIITKN